MKSHCILLWFAMTAGAAFSVCANASDKIAEFQALCDPHGTQLVSVNVPCLKALLANSQDPIYNMADPATQLFMIDAARLQARVEAKTLREDVAKEKYLRGLIALQDHHRPDDQLAQSRDDAENSRRERLAAQRASADDAIRERNEAAARREELAQSERREREASQAQEQQDSVARLQAIQDMNAQQSRESAIQFCIAQATAKSKYAFNAATACRANPNYYQTVFRDPVVTNCQGLGANQVTCRTQ